MADNLVDLKISDYSADVLEAMGAAVDRALIRIGSQAEGYAKDLCPVQTGLLKNSITYALRGQTTAISSYKADVGDKTGTYSGTAPNDEAPTVYIGTNVEYAADVELGTRKKGPRAFLKPAVTGHLQTYRNIVEDEFKNA